MREDVAAVNVTRSYTLAGTNIAIFTFMLFFLYPRFESGRINPLLFQATLIAMGVATFSLVFATLHYYRCSLGGGMSDAERTL
jgi:cell shape-determining protein MreD